LQLAARPCCMQRKPLEPGHGRSPFVQAAYTQQNTVV
jgi:hypothetical protein